MLGVGSGRVLLFRVGSFFCNSSLERAASRQHVTLRSISRTPTTMVEGHQCHRVAHFHRKKLLGHSFKATSPNGRFIDGAAAIADKPLVRIEVHGKNLFYFFGDDTNAAEMVCLHFHFGMSGAFATHPLPGPEPKATTRLALTNEAQNIVAHLSAMTVQHGDLGKVGSRVKARIVRKHDPS